MPVVVRGECAGEELSCVGLRVARDLFGRAGRDDLAALVAALGTEIDQPVGRLDHIEIMLDDDERRAGVEKFAKRSEKLGDVVEVQAGGRLVEDIEDFLVLAAGEMRSELETLCFAA